jgi:hypothetical protein
VQLLLIEAFASLFWNVLLIKTTVGMMVCVGETEMILVASIFSNLHLVIVTVANCDKEGWMSMTSGSQFEIQVKYHSLCCCWL